MKFHLNFDDKSPIDKPALCRSCRWAHIERGPNGEQRIECTSRASRDNVVKFKVTECSEYTEVNRQTLSEMKITAWILGTKMIVGLAGGRGEDNVQVTWSKPGDRQEGQPSPSPE